MQAFALTVIDFDGGKITQLADELTSQGYAVVTGSVSQTDQAVVDQATATIAADPTAAPAGEAPTQDTLAPQVVTTGNPSSPDNTQPFKCPECGSTFDVEVVCATQHDPTPVQPTAQVTGTTASAEGSDTGGGGEAPAASPAAASDPAAPAGDAAAADPSAPSDPAWPQ